MLRLAVRIPRIPLFPSILAGRQGQREPGIGLVPSAGYRRHPTGGGARIALCYATSWVTIPFSSLPTHIFVQFDRCGLKVGRVRGKKQRRRPPSRIASGDALNPTVPFVISTAVGDLIYVPKFRKLRLHQRRPLYSGFLQNSPSVARRHKCRSLMKLL